MSKRFGSKCFATAFSFLLVAMLCVVAIPPQASALYYWPNSSMGPPDITWSGRGWWVYDHSYYDASYVSIDGNGWLHLRQHASIDSGISTSDKCGYGTYKWVMKGFTTIDKYAVVGMNPYLSDGTQYNYHEMDIEQAMWGNSQTGRNYDFWVQPNIINLKQLFYQAPRTQDTTFVIDWERTWVTFWIIDTATNGVLRTWNATVSHDAMANGGVYGVTNAWHYSAPTTLDTEVIFKSFTYQRDTIFTLTGCTYPPDISTSPTSSINATETYTYNPASVNSPTWSCTGKPSGMTINSGTGAISWPNAVVGDYPLVLTATNGCGSDTQSWTLHVAAPVVAPTITSTPGTVVTEKIAYSYNPAASESANWACSGMPSGMTVNPITGAIYWSYSIYGDYPLTLYANNSGGSDNQTWNLHVDTESIKATITSSPITTGVVGGRYVYGISTSLPVTSYYVTGNATGMTVSSNGIVTWVPLHNGTYSVHLLVANSAGYDYQNYTVTVHDAASTNDTVPIDPGAVIPDDQTGALISMCIVGILILGVVRFAFG